MALPTVVDELLAADARSLDDTGLGERIADLEQVIRRAQAAQADAVRVFEVRDAADGLHSPSAAWWLCDRLGASERDARALVGLGRALDRLPALAAAFRAGTVTAAHVRAVTTATRALDPATVARGERFLAATAPTLDARRFAVAVRRWVATVAPADFERDTERRYDGRWLALSDTYGGMVGVSGMLDPEGGRLVKQAVDAIVSANVTDDLRSRDQQRADGLTDLVRLALGHADATTTGSHRPEVVVHVAADGTPELAGVGPLTSRAFDRLACDARWSTLVVDVTGVPIAYGRSRRDVPASLRKFVALRDGGCRYPGCVRTPAFCEVHHVRHWRDGGPTDAGNLALLCCYHHHLVHDRRHAMTLRSDVVVQVVRPDGRVLTGRPRGPTEVSLW